MLRSNPESNPNTSS
jgi:hypothetical protein